MLIIYYYMLIMNMNMNGYRTLLMGLLVKCPNLFTASCTADSWVLLSTTINC